MKSKYVFEKKENYLYLMITGEYDKDDFLSYPKMIRNECEKEKIFNVLLNGLEIKESDVTIIDRLIIAKEIIKVFGNKIKLAAVWPEKDINKFLENVVVSAGGNVYVAGNIETARDWLLNNTTKGSDS